MRRYLLASWLLGMTALNVVAQPRPGGPIAVPPPPLGKQQPLIGDPPPIRGGDVRVPGLNVPARPKVDSHQPLPGEENVPDIRDLLSGLNNNQKKPDLDPKMLQDLMSKLPKDQKIDPKQFQDLLKNNPQFKDPEFLKNLQKLLDSPDFAKNLQNQFGEGPRPKIDNPNDLANKFNEVINQGKDNLNPLNPNPINPMPNGFNPANPLEGEAMNNDWVKAFEKMFGNSVETNDLIKDIASAMGNADLKDLLKDFPELSGKEWKEFGDWTKMNLGLKPGDLPDFKLGSTNSGGGGGGSFNGLGGGGGGGGGGSFGGGGAAAGGLGSGAGMVIGIIAGVAAIALIAFVLFRKWKLEKAQQAALAAAGKNGLDLSAIRTREELVAAFDAVSLEKIGDDARNWNHRVIAEQLAEVEPTHSDPANELAGLYERARYAPADEDLSPNEFADARRDLTVIAGASS